MTQVIVKIFPTRLEAELAKSALEACGIATQITADDAGGARPAPMAYKNGVELTVAEKDKEEAEKILL